MPSATSVGEMPGSAALAWQPAPNIAATTEKTTNQLEDFICNSSEPFALTV
jgi:hypothetical protein